MLGWEGQRGTKSPRGDAFRCRHGDAGPKSSIGPPQPPSPSAWLEDALWASQPDSASTPKHRPRDQLLRCPGLGRRPTGMIYALTSTESPGIGPTPRNTTNKGKKQGWEKQEQGPSTDDVPGLRCPRAELTGSNTAGSSQHLPRLPYLQLETEPPCSPRRQRVRTHQFSTKHSVSFRTFFFLNCLTMKQFKGR